MSEITNDTEVVVAETTGEKTPELTKPPACVLNGKFIGLLIHQMLNASDCRNVYGADEKHEKHDHSEYVNEAILGALKNLSPNDEIEAMLIGKMIVMHNVAMECMKHAITYNNYTGKYSYGQDDLEMSNKCTRSFVMLAEALNRHRSKGQQKMVVEHVHVYPGGQAIVGNVTSGGRGGAKKLRKPHAP